MKHIAISLAFAFAVLTLAARAAEKPNILVIFGDDIGIANVSQYSNGLMGYDTPNIDRIGKEGITFLQYYGEQSCTAGRRPSSPARTSSAPASAKLASPLVALS